MSSYMDIAKVHITADEGRRSKPYTDTVGKITIGIGYNLTDLGLPDDIIDTLFERCAARADKVCKTFIPTFGQLSDNRKAALVDMAFDLDEKIADFHEMIRCLNHDDFAGAAAAVLDSRFAKQVGKRADRIAAMLRDG